MIGLIEDLKHVTTMWFKDEGDLIVLLGENREELGASEYLMVIHNLVKGETPELDLQREKKVQDACLEMIRTGLIKSAHDCSEGGIAAALAESCISSPNRLGAKIRMDDKIRADTLLFGETQSRIIVSMKPEHWFDLEKITRKHQIPFSVLGKVEGHNLNIEGWIDLPVSKLAEEYESAIDRIMEKKVEAV
jgi:phosphoribosylformylglycinamidine synthase